MTVLSRGPCRTLLLSIVLAGCADSSSEVRLTSPAIASLEGVQYGSQRPAALAASLTPFTSPMAAELAENGPRVGILAYCTDLTGAVGAENAANTLIADGRFSAVAVVDGDANPPSAGDLLAAYDVVLAMTDARCGVGTPEAQQVGDAAAAALVGFVEGGGGVALSAFGFSKLPEGIGFGAAIYDLSPFQSVQGFNGPAGPINLDGASAAPECASLLDGVSSPLSSFYANQVTVSEGAALCASYSNGNPVLAINGDRNVVAVNVFPANQSDNAQASFQRLVGNAVFAVSGRTHATRTIENGEAAAVTVGEDSDGDGDVEQVAGADFPANAFVNDPDDPNDDNVTVTVSLRKVEPGDAPCHAFLIGQIGRCMEINATYQDGTEALLATPVRVGVCLDEHHHVDIYKFEEPTGEARPLRQTDISDFLDCTDFQVSSARPKNWLHGLAMRVGKIFTPKDAWAADRGMGGFVDDGRFSFFTWASPVQVTHARLRVNVRDKERDRFEVTGVFDLVTPKGFEPAASEVGFDPAQPIAIRYGKTSFTIPPNALKWRPLLRRYTYTTLSLSTGITSIVINPSTGGFVVAGIVPTEGEVVLPAFRPFTIQLGNRLRGAALLCGETRTYVCTFEVQQ